MAEELATLSPAEARLLGCLAEKRLLTPDIYPLTLNAALAAANQKTAREPAMALDEAEVRRALATLETKGLARKIFATRVERYEHLLPQKFSLAHGQVALLALLLLRGAQTAHELLARAERMANFPGIDDVRATLDLLIGRRPPLVVLLDRGPGQREERYAHLLSGPVESVAPPRASHAPPSDLEARVEALERQVAVLQADLKALIG